MLYTRSIPLVNSENLNYNNDARKRTIEYFYRKSIQKWFYEDIDMKKVLCFINDSNNLVKSMDEYKKNKSKYSDESNLKKKIKFLIKIVFTKKYVDHLLKKFTQKKKYLMDTFT